MAEPRWSVDPDTRRPANSFQTTLADPRQGFAAFDRAQVRHEDVQRAAAPAAE